MKLYARRGDGLGATNQLVRIGKLQRRPSSGTRRPGDITDGDVRKGVRSVQVLLGVERGSRGERMRSCHVIA